MNKNLVIPVELRDIALELVAWSGDHVSAEALRALPETLDLSKVEPHWFPENGSTGYARAYLLREDLQRVVAPVTDSPPSGLTIEQFNFALEVASGYRSERAVTAFNNDPFVHQMASAMQYLRTAPQAPAGYSREQMREAVDRVKDLYRNDDGQAWDEAKKFLEKIGEHDFLASTKDLR